MTIDSATARDVIKCCAVGDVEDAPAEKRQRDNLQFGVFALNLLGYGLQVVPDWDTGSWAKVMPQKNEPVCLDFKVIELVKITPNR